MLLCYKNQGFKKRILIGSYQFFQVTSSAPVLESVKLSSALPEDELDEPNKEFLPEVGTVSKQSARSNVSNDEFDLDDDSRQLSLDQSFPESRQSESGKRFGTLN